MLHYSTLATTLWVGVTARNIYKQVTRKAKRYEELDEPPPPPRPMLRFDSLTAADVWQKWCLFKLHPPNDSLVQPSEHVVILLMASELLFHPVLSFYYPGSEEMNQSFTYFVPASFAACVDRTGAVELIAVQQNPYACKYHIN